MYRVTYFSNWEKPQHFEGLTAEEQYRLVVEGRDQQYKVFVTLMTESAPTNL